MVTITIDAWTIVAVTIPFVIAAFLILFFQLTEVDSELKMEKYTSKYYEGLCNTYRDELRKCRRNAKMKENRKNNGE